MASEVRALRPAQDQHRAQHRHPTPPAQVTKMLNDEVAKAEAAMDASRP